MKRVELLLIGLPVRVIRLELQPAREPAAQHELNAVVARIRAVGDDVRLVDVRVGHPEVRRHAGGEALCKEGGRRADQVRGRERIRVQGKHRLHERRVRPATARILRRVAHRGRSIQVRQQNRERCGARHARVGKRAAPARGDVRNQIRLRHPELVDELVLDNVELVVVQVPVHVIEGPGPDALGVDVPRLDGRGLAEAALPAAGEGVAVWRLDVGIEREHVRAGVRHGHRERPGQLDADGRQIAAGQEPRQGAEVVVLLAAGRVDGDARIATEDTGEVAHAPALIPHAVARPQHRVARLAEDRVQGALVRSDRPGRAEARRDVAPVDVVGLRPFRQLLEGRRRALDRPRLEQIAQTADGGSGNEPAAGPRDAEDVADGRLRIAVVQREERHLHVIAQAGVDGERRLHAPRVLHEGAPLRQGAVLIAGTQHGKVRPVVADARLAADRRDPAREDRVQIPRVREVGGGRPWKIRGHEHPVRGIAGGRHPEVDLRNELLVVQPDARTGVRHARAHRVGALDPVQRVLEDLRLAFPCAGGILRAWIAEGLEGAPPDVVPVHVAHGRAPVHRDRQVRRELRRPAGRAKAHLVDEVVGQRRPQPALARVTLRILQAVHGEAGEHPLPRVGRVGVGQDVVARGREGRPVFRRHVVVQAHGRVRRLVRRRRLPRQRLRQRVRRRRQGALRRRRAHVGQQLGHDRIDPCELAVLGRQRHQIDGASSVLKQSLLRERAHDGPGARNGAGRTNLLVVDEEERPVAAGEQPRDRHRTADAEAGLELREHRLGQRRAGRVDVAVQVEPRVRVHPVAAQIVVAAAGELVGPGARDELHLHGPLAGHVRALRGRGDRDLLDGVQARAHTRKHPVRRLQVVVLDVHAVERDVDRALRKAVHRGAADGAVRRADPRHVGHEVEGGAAGHRQVGDLPGAQRLGDRGRLRLHDLARRADRDGLLDPARLEHRPHGRRLADRDDDVLQDGGLESLERHVERIGARRHRRNGKGATRRGHSRERRPGLGIRRRDIGARHGATRAVAHRARN